MAVFIPISGYYTNGDPRQFSIHDLRIHIFEILSNKQIPINDIRVIGDLGSSSQWHFKYIHEFGSSCTMSEHRHARLLLSITRYLLFVSFIPVVV
jgi:hypothetical protein